MGFLVPRLRRITAAILQNYPDFLKKPDSYLVQLHEVLINTESDLAERCVGLIRSDHKPAEIEEFIGDLRIFLSANADKAFSADDEARLNKSPHHVKGVGDKLCEALEKFGIESIRDLIYALPIRYEILTEDVKASKSVLTGVFEESRVMRTRQGKNMFHALFRGNKGYFGGLWLHFNKQFPSSLLSVGKRYHLYGSVTAYSGVPSIFHPEFLEDYEVGSVRPVYTVPGKFSQKVYQNVLGIVMQDYLPCLGESLPERIRFKYRYPDAHDAFNTLHRPETRANIDLIATRQHPAFARLVYEELFYLHLRLLMRKRSYENNQGIMFDIPRRMLEEIAELMPFRLTDAQRRAVREIYADMRSPSQMNRLLQGDVGSGKTIVSFVSALVAVKNGYQAVILAPTEVLAEQHYYNLEIFLRGSGYNSCLLTGSVKQSEKRDIKALIAAGDIHFIVGTHALLQNDVVFHKLGFAVIDEQHRFGVKQRKTLMEKGTVAPDILLMTATPIPRTLALTVYGDLDLSEINSMPPGRIEPVTRVYREKALKEAYAYVAEHLKEGDRAYFVYPAIEETDKNQLKAATKSVEVVQKYFKGKRVGLLHGRLKTDEKHAMLDAFRNGEIDILVSTTVVEVGVDVRDATVILIENADRFGLAQLHQLRGRVGRNNRQSYCVLVASGEISETGMKRLRAMESNTSGFSLAQIDLELRGQGDFFGVRQSGIPEFKFADIVKDADIVRQARRDAAEIIEDDPLLQKDRNMLIKSVLMQRWREEYEYFLIG